MCSLVKNEIKIIVVKVVRESCASKTQTRKKVLYVKDRRKVHLSMSKTAITKQLLYLGAGQNSKRCITRQLAPGLFRGGWLRVLLPTIRYENIPTLILYMYSRNPKLVSRS